jgi:hypothetical protein
VRMVKGSLVQIKYGCQCDMALMIARSSQFSFIDVIVAFCLCKSG